MTLILMDGSVHLIAEKTGSKDSTPKGKLPGTFYAKCGFTMSQARKPDEFTVWNGEVTCQACIDYPFAQQEES